MHYFKKKLKNWKKYIYIKEPGKALVDLVS